MSSIQHAVKWAVTAIAVMTLVSSAAQAGTVAAGDDQLLFTDRFGRTINEFGLVLVDWEGHLANPAIEFFVHPPASATFPATTVLSGNGVRLYFDLPSQVSAAGPTKTLFFSNPSPKAVKVSIFPDRDDADEQYQLTIQFTDSGDLELSQNLEIQIIDQDIERSFEYNVLANFSEDQSGFFDGGQERDIMQQAARDWAYFVQDMNLDTVASGAQSTWIWNYPLAWTGPPPNGHWVTNGLPYEGFLLYAYGINTPELRSGGEPSTCCFHSSGGVTLPLRRSGGVEIEIKGNFNTLGWFLTAGDDDWWFSGNLGNEPNDLYSIAHHEFGHTLAFNSGHPGFAAGEAGTFDDPAIIEYHGSAVTVNRVFDHFEGVVDRASGRGIFGNEYFGSMPRRRWLITKLDILLMQAVGYPLRQTSSLVPLLVPDFQLVDGQIGMPYMDSIPAVGGIPFYHWVLESGELPPGLALDQFTGTISGTPTNKGVYALTFRVFDYDDGPGVAARAVIAISADLCPADLNGDGSVGILDLLALLAAWGTDPGGPPDFNGDGIVGILDLLTLLANWGRCA